MRLPIIVRENKIAFAIGAAVVLVAAFLGYLATVNPTWSPIAALRGDGNGVSNSEKKAAEKVEAEERLQGALQFVPSTAIMATHANLSAVEGGQEWWSYYNRFTSPLYALPSDLPETLGVTSITYASFPTEVEDYAHESPFSDVIVLTAPQEQGEAVLAHVNAENNGATFAHYTEDEDEAFVIISDIPGYETVAELVAGDASDTDTFAGLERAQDFTVDAPSPTMYINMSDYLENVTAALPEKQDFIDTMFTKGIGIKDNTTWLGSSSDQGITWEGSFLSGGVDAEAVDISAFTTAIYNEMEFLSGEGEVITEPGVDPDNGIVDSGYVIEGLSVVAEAISVAKGEEKVGQILNPHNHEAKRIEAEAPTGDEEVVIVFSPQMFLSTFHGVIKPHSVHTVTLRVMGEKSTVEFDFYDDDDFVILEAPEDTPVEEEDSSSED